MPPSAEWECGRGNKPRLKPIEKTLQDLTDNPRLLLNCVYEVIGNNLCLSLYWTVDN